MDPQFAQVLSSIIPALIGAAGVAVPTIIANKQSTALWQYRLEQLEKTVNSLAAKLDGYQEQEKELVELEARISHAEGRLDRIEKQLDK